MSDKFTPQELKDALSSFESGVNQGVSPLLLQKNQLAGATNLTVRGTYAHPRPPYRKLGLDYGGIAGVQSAFEGGLFQGACYYKPDAGPECLMAAVSGKLYQLVIGATSASVTYVSSSTTNPVTDQDGHSPQHWLWQSECFVIWDDGSNLPVFYTTNPKSTFGPIHRSNYATRLNYGTWNTAPFVIPAYNATVTGVTVNDATNLVVGDVVILANKGQMQVQNIVGANIDFLNLTASPVGQNVPAQGGNNIYWSHTGTELPAGRMGAYGMGRNWLCLTDGKQFVASDIVGGASGSQQLNFRDAVLHITENNFLVGGGNFTVPGSPGDIKAMRFAATLDASLGQGPLQVFTPDSVFSCNAPVDRTTWQSITNPILTESLIGNGALSQNATILANGDFLFRSVDGIRSLILARRDFDTWGNVPQSREVDPIIAADNQGLLQFGSAVLFDNRMLMTARPTQADQGVYHPIIIALNFDPISSLRGKAPSVYDGQWIGINVLQLVTGRFGGFDRCFAFTLNTATKAIELYEISKSASTQIYDNDDSQGGSIVMSLESASLFNKHQADPKNELLKRLIDGEIMVDNLIGTVQFQAFWKPDQWPCWVPWLSWQECSDPATTTISKPGFRPRMGLGEPPTQYKDPVTGVVTNFCDASNDRPLREFYTCQFKLTYSGHCQFLGAHFKSVTVPQDQFAAPDCCKPLPPPQTPLI